MQNNLTYDQIFKVIERLTGRHIVSYVAEARTYSVKFFDGSMRTIDIEFVDSYARTIK